MENTAMHCITQKGIGSSRKKKKPIPVDMHAISTMIIRSIFEIKDGQATDHLTDYKWVEFAKTTSGKGYMSYSEAKSKNKLQTIKEVLEDLNDHRNDSGQAYWENGKATYTIFVNEFYYDKEPGGMIMHPGKSLST